MIQLIMPTTTASDVEIIVTMDKHDVVIEQLKNSTEPSYYSYNTKNLISVGAMWQTDPSYADISDASGQSEMDQMNITFIRYFNNTELPSESNEDFISEGQSELIQWLTIFIVVGIPIIIIVVTIILAVRKVHDWYIWNKYRSK
jgi:hypothetical protein